VLPNLEGGPSGDSIRVPVPAGRLAGILEHSDDPLVASGIVGSPASSIFDSALTRVDGRHVKVVAWYHNEWCFSNRVVDTRGLMANR
jgi:glyceraldehyde 3-phosphate dehydrogenase